MKPVDLRSDTVTRPTPEMYAAIASATLGDDVLGDDPTVTELEAEAALAVGKEAAVFVPSGTMGNQIALASHCNRGDAILIEEEAHILYYEVGAPAMIAGVVSWTIPSKLGIMDPGDVARRTLKANLHTPGTTLLCLESSHNRGGGTVIPLATMAAYREVADRDGMKVHLDGARVFNAAVSLGVPATDITKHVDSVNFCLSKGLRSPVGSVLCGPLDFIERARTWRKRLGGGMRQAGILAACGLVSLRGNIDRLADDHRRARALAAGLAELPGVTIEWERVQTNIILVGVEGAAQRWASQLKSAGVWCFPVGPSRLRLVLHADVDDADVDRAIDAFAAVAKTAVS
ncbi:MAG: threonine aldolase family protein [Fimbriimonadaceae bacterium]